MKLKHVKNILIVEVPYSCRAKLCDKFRHEYSNTGPHSLDPQ